MILAGFHFTGGCFPDLTVKFLTAGPQERLYSEGPVTAPKSADSKKGAERRRVKEEKALVPESQLSQAPLSSQPSDSEAMLDLARRTEEKGVQCSGADGNPGHLAPEGLKQPGPGCLLAGGRR